MRQETATGPEYLRLATTLLQRMRLASPEGGIWEAADIQWWSRLDQRTGLFWLDENGAPRAAFLATGFRRSVQCDVLVLPGDELASHLVAVGLDLLAAHGCGRLKVSSDRDLYLRAGFGRLDSATAGTYARPDEAVTDIVASR